jgi:hypothetical protein
MNHTRECHNYTLTCQNYTRMCVNPTLRIKSHSASGNYTLRVEMRVEITLERVAITFVRFKMTLWVKITLCEYKS